MTAPQAGRGVEAERAMGGVSGLIVAAERAQAAPLAALPQRETSHVLIEQAEVLKRNRVFGCGE